MTTTSEPSRDVTLHIAARRMGVMLVFMALASSGISLRASYADVVALPRGAAMALAILLIYGRRSWPLLLAGASLVRLILAVVSGATLSPAVIGGALAIGMLQTVEAFVGASIVRRSFGAPMNIRGAGHFLRVALLVGPVLTMLSATAGIAIFVIFGQVTSSGMLGNWIAWWVGDTIGILTITPVALMWPSRAPSPLRWRGIPLPRLQGPSLAYVLVSLTMTLAAWQAMTSLMVHYQQNQFDTLVSDNRHVLEDRLKAYAVSLDGAEGFIGASREVTAPEWKAFILGYDLPHRLPGIRGIGFALAGMNGSGAPEIPVRYIEPQDDNPGLPGFDIASVPKWRDAAEAARDSGDIQLSGWAGTSADPRGALLIHPVYGPMPATGAEPNTVAERRAAIRGWVFAPINDQRLFSNFTASHLKDINFALYDGRGIRPDALIYADRGLADNRHPVYTSVSRVSAFGQSWTLVAESTPEFENAVNRAAPSTILGSGILFTTMLTLYLLSLSRREDRISEQVATRTRELAAQIEENRSIIETPNANIALLDNEGVILFSNASFRRLFGYGKDSPLGRPLPDLLGGAARDYFSLSGHRREPSDYRGEVRTTTRRGTSLVLDVQINAWVTAEGQRRHTTLITDVTDKRRVETELRDARNRLDIALTGAKIGVFEVDLATDTATVSPTWLQHYGFAPDARIDAQAEFRRRLHPDDRQRLETSDRACIEGLTERSITEARIRRVDGSWRWLRSEAVAAERDASGRATRLIGTTTDVTELIESKDALRHSEERFRSAIEAAPVGMAIIAPDGRFLKVNDALTRLVGISTKVAGGQPFHHFLHPDDRLRVRGMVATVLEGARDSFETELRCLHADGGEVWGRLSLAIIRNREGQPESFVIQVHDLTEQRRAERIKNEFIATVSHELRTPLTSINGSLELLVNGVAGTVPERARAMLTIARKNCSRLILLVNDILDMEKLASRKMTFDLAGVSIPEAVQAAVANTRPLAEQAGVDFDLAEPDEDFFGWVDANRFQQVMANLLSNAVKFSAEGDTVEIAVERQGRIARVSVTDHGPGVPLSFRSKIFTAFSQADSSSTRARSGTGLGLSISRQIVEQLGGTIGFTSEPGIATTFWFTVPLIGPEEAESAAGTSPAAAEPVGRPRILHVEANADFAQIIAASFGERAEVRHAHDHAEAISLAGEDVFDLVLLDGAGGSVTAAIDSLFARIGEIPVVALSSDDTGLSDNRIRHRFIKTRALEQAVVKACLACIRSGTGGGLPEVMKGAPAE